eukprot:TRINITY_DN11065_c0_g1_i1.p1 TRINITY_DN11065_c0_g1~~TRINITY_DN11065_c0_g1_i1.p1  ORF type:complete len:127 (-),score=38.75 TRINITY_DN11065_c0_g1_i1:31-411(-)
MVQEAEKFRSEDESNKAKIEAKNGRENYCFTMRNTLNEEKLKVNSEGGDKEKLEAAVQEILDWLDKNQLAEKDEFEGKQKELGNCQPHHDEDHDEGLSGRRRRWYAGGWHARKWRATRSWSWLPYC